MPAEQRGGDLRSGSYVPFISFASHHRGNGGGTWEKMYHYFQFRRTEFLQHYHKRS